MRLAFRMPENKETMKTHQNNVKRTQPTEGALTDQRWKYFSVDKDSSCSFETY